MIVFQYFRSLLFTFLMYLLMPIIGITMAIPSIFSERAAYWAIRGYSGCVIWLARVLCGIKLEIRGKVPQGDVVIASKHQSFFDVIIHTYLLHRVNFVMKQELRWAPILGFYAARIGAAPVKRGEGNRSVSQMMDGVDKQQTGGASQLVIYPQGTRVGPGETRPYKVGAAVISQRTGKPCYMAATNVGVFWRKHSILRHPGTVIMEYLGQVPEGLDPEEFTKYLENTIEPASNALMEEAGYKSNSN